MHVSAVATADEDRPVDPFQARFCDLKCRTAGGLSVTLLWDRVLRLPFVHVHDSSTGEFFVLEPSPGDVSFAYAHPTVAAGYLPMTSMAEVVGRLSRPLEVAA